jgi:hypothetical protein
MVCVPVSLVLLLPSIYVYYWAFNTLAKRNISVGLQKLFLAFIGLIGVFFTYYLIIPSIFYLISPGDWPFIFGDADLIIFPVSYGLMVVVTSFAFKPKIAVENC